MDNTEQTLTDLLKSINNSIEDIRNHPTEVDKLPSNFEILIRGVASNKAVDAIFSSKLDGIINMLIQNIENGNLEQIIQNKDLVTRTASAIFGDKAFKGPVSNAVLNNIQGSVQSIKYQNMRSILGKTGITIKKLRLVIKNLEKGEDQFKYNSEDLQKYRDAVYAIKQTLKFIARIYRSRKIINRKVFDGLSNVVYESEFSSYEEYDEAL